MEELIKKVTEICVEYQKEKEKEGLDYNIFSMLDIERRELKTHEYMIYAIMNLSQDRGLSVSFINKFLEAMGLPKKFTMCDWGVDREYDIGDGRIDLFLKSKDKIKLCVAVEMKIDAGDQERQLKRYDVYCKKYVDYRIIYLTLDGKEATEKSVEGLEDKRKIINASFNEHVVHWLEECINVCKTEGVDASFIKQYEVLVKKITKGEGMENKVKGLIKGSDRVKACMAIVKALEEVKEDIICGFFKKLYYKLGQKCKVLDWNYECTTDRPYRYITCGIRSIKVRNRIVTIGICVELGYRLEYCIIYSDEKWNTIDSKAFKEKNKRIAELIEGAVEESLQKKVTDNQWTSIKYFNVRNSQNKEYDFKHFDETCAELADEEILYKKYR